MPNSLSAKKRVRQNETSRLRNKSVMSEIKTLTKKFVAFAEAGDKDEAARIYPRLIARLDRAGQNRLLHPNNAARRKSQVMRLMNSLQG